MATASKPVTTKYRDAADLLTTHIQHKRGRYRKRSPLPPPSEKEVKEEIKRILDEFLKKQSMHIDGYAAALPTGYQRVYEEDVIETDGPSDTKSPKSSSIPSSKENASVRSAAGSIHSLTDDRINFPFADDVEIENEQSSEEHDERSKSLPSSILSSVKQSKSDKPAALSKSMSPSHLVSTDKTRHLPSTPVKQAGRNHKQKTEEISGDKVVELFPSKASSSSPSSTSSKDIEEIGIGRRGSDSSSDTCGSRSVVSPDRKKKSIFKRVKERLNRSLTREHEEGKGEKTPQAAKKDRKRPKSRGGRGKVKESKRSELLDERRTHVHGHIEQHHYENGGHVGVVRQQEIWESTDINDIEHSQSKHEEKHKKVTESMEVSDSSEGGILSRIKRLASFKKRKKPAQIKESKSADLRRNEPKDKAYYRSVSAHPMVNETEVLDTADGRVTHRTQICARDIPEGNFNGTQPPEFQPNSPTGSLGLNEGADLEKMAKNKSFILDFDSDQVRRRRRLTGGQIDTEVETHVHNHQQTGDIEEDGQPGKDETDDGKMLHPPTPDSLRSEDEKDKVYTLVAERLAEIGDSYMTTSPYSDSASSSVDHRQLHSSSQSRDAEGLNSLERELRDTFREIGDRVNDTIDISPVTAANAAQAIATHATYKTFEDTVKKTVGDGHSWNQLAAIFYLTKKSVHLAGAGGAVALKVKDMAAQYVAEKFAGWIVDQGGWDTCLESGSDSELD